MKVVFTEPALDDLNQIRRYLQSHYPSVATSVEKRLRIVVAASASGQRAHPASLNAPAFVLRCSSGIRTKSFIASRTTWLRYCTSITHLGERHNRYINSREWLNQAVENSSQNI